MHTTLRAIAIVLVTFLLGTAVDVGTAYWLGGTPQGQKVLRDFLVSHTIKSQMSTGPDAPATTTQPGVLLVPKTLASESYFLAINGVLQDTYLIDSVNNQFGPVLDKLNTLTLSCSYTNFFDLMSQARQLANKNQVLIAQFQQHITALEAANLATAEAITKSDTSAAISTGRALGSALQTYATGVQSILYGNIPPASADIATVQQQVTSATAASQAFADALKPLLTHIIEEDQRLITAASSTQAH